MTRVLVVDAEATALEAVRADLESADYEVVAVAGAEAALEALAPRQVDLVMVGLDRPDDDLMARIRATDATLPILALGGADASPASFARGLERGAEDILWAPLDPTVVRARVAAALDRRALRTGAESSLQKLEQLSHDLKDIILPLGVSLSTEKDTDQLLYRILVEAQSLCNADAATLYVRTKDDRLKFSIMRTNSLGIARGGPGGEDIPFPPLRMYVADSGEPNHRNIATHVALDGRAVNIADIYGSEAFDFTATRAFDKNNNYRSVSTLTVPLKDNTDRVVAVLQLLNALDKGSGKVIPFDSYQQLVVESLASQAAVVFNNQLLLQRQADLLKFERDLQIGRQIQAGFLPESLPSVEGYRVAVRFMPAREVAGDFYDAFMLGQDTMGFVVADVCDKGVGAALFMALVRSLVRVYSQQRYAALTGGTGLAGLSSVAPAFDVTAEALRQAIILANEYIGQNHLNMNMFATMFAGVLHLASGEIAYVNAGHNAPMLRSAEGTTTRLPSKSPAVGMMPGFQFEAVRTHISAGDLLVVFSDGIPDARDPHGKFFTEGRLLQMVEATPVTAAAEEVAANVQGALIEHISTAAQFDDITMMVIRRV